MLFIIIDIFIFPNLSSFSKNEIFETGHHFVVSFKITLHDRMSDPSVLLTSTILLTFSGLPFSLINNTTSPTSGTLEIMFRFLPDFASSYFASRSLKKSKYKALKSLSMLLMDILKALYALPRSFFYIKVKSGSKKSSVSSQFS